MVPSKRVLLLRDGPAALSLIRYASTGLSCAPYCAANLAYSSLDMTGSQSDDWSDITLVYIGTWDEDHVYVPFPSLGKVSGDLSFYWARLAQWELCKQYRAYCSIAVLQTTGGGWASLRRVDKALECAVQLYYVAGVVGNDEIAQKCRIFVGWSCLWMGDQTSALLIFYSELASARRKKDIVHKRRCLHAIAHAKSNPNVLGAGVGSTTIMDEVLCNMLISAVLPSVSSIPLPSPFLLFPQLLLVPFGSLYKNRSEMGKRPRDVECPLIPPLRELQRLRKLKKQLSTLKDGDTIPPHVWVNRPSTPSLDSAVKEYLSMKELSTTQFYATFVIPFLDAALRFYDLFEVDAHDCESFCDVWVNREKGVFSKDQILSILGNAFFCSFAVREEVYEDDLPSIGYDEIHTGDARVLVTKLRLLFDYVTETVCPTAANTPERMEVYRCELASLPPPHDSNDTVQPPVMHQLGESIDDQQSMIRLDFANAWIGGGALADGCVQEEITFAQCCGLNTLRWNQRPLKEEESVVVKGYAQYGVVEKGTYGFNISYGGCIAGGKIMGGALAVVDAADFRFHPASDQYSTAFIRRELQKLLSALLHPSVKDITSVAGGNWGCGIFGGDYELKFLIQWLACCISKKQLHYFPFDNECFEEFNSTLCALVESGCTVKELEEFLLVSEIPETRSVWDSFVTFFAEARQAKLLNAEDDESD